jgi:DNA polymerase-3 subunit delta
VVNPKDPSETLRLRLEKGDIPLILFLHGQDGGRILALVEQLRSRCLEASTRSLNLNAFDARESPISTVLDSARTLPMFSAWRVVLVTNASAWGKTEWEKAVPYLQDPSPSTCLIFRGEKPPPSQDAALAIRGKGLLLELRPRSQGQAVAWVTERIRRENRRILPEAARALVERVGTLEGDLEGEIQKLLVFSGHSGPIGAEEVEEVAAAARTHKLYDLTDALSEYRTGDALRILHRLSEDGAAPLALLGMMVRQVRLLWHASEASRGDRPRSEWAEGLAIPPFLQERLLRQARKWDDSSLRRALEGLVKIDRMLKGGRSDPELLMDRWVLSQAARGPRDGTKPPESRGRRQANSLMG